MQKINKNWSILVYAIILINIALIVTYIILNKSMTFIDNMNSQNINLKLNQELGQKANNSIKYDLYLNSDWSWFVDTISCPSNITLSWTIWETINTIPQTFTYFDTSNNILYCSWTTSSWNLLLSYNLDFSWFSWATYNNWSWDLVDEVLYFSGILNDSELTNIYFNKTTEKSWLDSNFNSDDYKASSTWSIYYPDNFEDNDNLARKTMFWYIPNNWQFYNIFWNNYKTNKFISNNTNNLDYLNTLIWETSTWKIFVDMSNIWDLKVVEFDAWIYTERNELKKIIERNWTGLTQSWYISEDLDANLYLSTNYASWKIFNFKDKNYWIFISNPVSNNSIMKYRLSWKNEYWSWIYLNPIDDSDPSNIKYLSSHIMIEDWKYINKISNY